MRVREVIQKNFSLMPLYFIDIYIFVWGNSFHRNLKSEYAAAKVTTATFRCRVLRESRSQDDARIVSALIYISTLVRYSELLGNYL